MRARLGATSSTGDLAACLRRMSYGNAMRRALMNQPAGDAVPYAQPLLDAVALFEELGIAYALVGGVASMYYGRARFTEDLDFVASSEHADVLDRNGEAMRRHRLDPGSTWKLYHQSGVEIDLWKDEFSDEIVRRAVEAELVGRRVRVAEPHDLIAMKLRAGRVQDDYDISEILRGPTAIEDAVVQARVTREQFAHYLAVKQRVKS
jgi:hypothetical protein